MAKKASVHRPTTQVPVSGVAEETTTDDNDDDEICGHRYANRRILSAQVAAAGEDGPQCLPGVWCPYAGEAANASAAAMMN